MKALTLYQNRAPSTDSLIRGSIFKLSTQKMEKAQLTSGRSLNSKVEAAVQGSSPQAEHEPVLYPDVFLVSSTTRSWYILCTEAASC